MKQSTVKQPTVALALRIPLLPRLPARIRRLVNATYAAYGGAEQMNLAAWRDAEQELKRRLESEHQESQR